MSSSHSSFDHTWSSGDNDVCDGSDDGRVDDDDHQMMIMGHDLWRWK